MEPAGKELSGDCVGVCVCEGWEGGLVLCFGKEALSFLEVVGLSGKEQ